MTKKDLINDKNTQLFYDKLVHDVFKGDDKKANEFVHEPNRELGGKSPMALVGEYKTKELNRFIDGKRRKYF